MNSKNLESRRSERERERAREEMLRLDFLDGIFFRVWSSNVNSKKLESRRSQREREREREREMHLDFQFLGFGAPT